MKYLRAFDKERNHLLKNLLVLEDGNSFFVYSYNSDVISNYAGKTIKFDAPLWYIEQIKPLLEEIKGDEFEQILSKDIGEYETIDIENYEFPPLYHGTDAKIIRMSEQERESYRTCCESVIKNLFPYYEQNYCFGVNRNFRVEINGLDDETKRNIEQALRLCDKMLHGNQLYQYPKGVIYLTNVGINLQGYAKKAFAGGELGFIAYYMCKVALNSGFLAFYRDNKIESAIQRVIEFGEKKREPVVIEIKYTDIDIKYLRSEAGDLITHGLEQSFRYSGPIKLDLSNFK